MTNVLFINSDNMRSDQLQYMPELRNKVARQGTTFANARVNVALCNPSRANTFLGQCASHSGYNNQGQFMSALTGLDLNKNVGKWCQDVGVRTGMFGKPYNCDGTYRPIPAGWSTWCHSVLSGQSCPDIGFSIDDGTTTTTPSGQIHDYWLAQLQAFTGGSEPWFAYFAPHSPHAPYNGNLNDVFCCNYVAKQPVFLPSTTGCPSWIAASPGLNPLLDVPMIQEDYRRQVRELQVLDSMLGTLMNSIDLTDTIVIFTCDNGAYYGEHRSTVFQYNDLYDGCLRVACVIAGPGFGWNKVEPGLIMLGADAVKTIVALYGAAPPHNLSGIDLRLPIPAGRTTLHDTNGSIGPVGLHNYNGHAIATPTRKLLRWDGTTAPDKYEMFDIDTDPEELVNVAYVGARLTERDSLEAALDALLVVP